MPRSLRNILFLVVPIVVLFTSCRKDPVVPLPFNSTPSGTVRLQFLPEWEGAPFLPFVERHNISGYRVQVELVQFYLSQMELVDPNQSITLSEVEFMDFNNGPVERFSRVPAGTWNSLGFGLGLSPELNDTDPTQYANDHPLSGSHGMYWDWEEAYIFTKFEGRHDLDPNSSGTFPNTFSIHTGSDTTFVQLELVPTVPMEVVANDTVTVTVRVAIDRFFHSEEAGVIDLETEYLAHGTNTPLAVKLSRNVAHSFTVD